MHSPPWSQVRYSHNEGFSISNESAFSDERTTFSNRDAMLEFDRIVSEAGG